MAWECMECLQEKMKVVCHHCGKPLCTEHAYVLADDAFSDHKGPQSIHAAHCKDCRQAYHPRAVLGQRTPA